MGQRDLLAAGRLDETVCDIISGMDLHIEFDREQDGRWIAEISQIPGVMVYGATRAEAEARVQALALRVVAEQLERDDLPIDHVGFAAA